MLRLHSVLQSAIEEQKQQDAQQRQRMLDEINHCIETYLGITDHVDADNCSGWLLGLMNAFDQKKVDTACTSHNACQTRTLEMMLNLLMCLLSL